MCRHHSLQRRNLRIHKVSPNKETEIVTSKIQRIKQEVTGQEVSVAEGSSNSFGRH